MEIKFAVPEAWIKLAEQCNIPKDLQEDLFKTYLDFITEKDNPYLGEANFDEWISSDDGEDWFREHGISHDEEYDENEED